MASIWSVYGPTALQPDGDTAWGVSTGANQFPANQTPEVMELNPTYATPARAASAYVVVFTVAANHHVGLYDPPATVVPVTSALGLDFGLAANPQFSHLGYYGGAVPLHTYWAFRTGFLGSSGDSAQGFIAPLPPSLYGQRDAIFIRTESNGHYLGGAVFQLVCTSARPLSHDGTIKGVQGDNFTLWTGFEFLLGSMLRFGSVFDVSSLNVVNNNTDRWTFAFHAPNGNDYIWTMRFVTSGDYFNGPPPVTFGGGDDVQFFSFGSGAVAKFRHRQRDDEQRRYAPSATPSSRQGSQRRGPVYS